MNDETENEHGPAVPGKPGSPREKVLKFNRKTGGVPYRRYELNIGDRIGFNRLMVCLGEGAMATIYKVWHEELEVVRALKILKKGFTREMRDRFITEAKILSDIHHPNIVEVHGFGYWQADIPYIEMEYVNGRSLLTLIKQNGALPLHVALTLAYFTALALSYAHRKKYTLYGTVYSGLIHRDIKPGNILLSSGGVVKLMDFGIARPSEVGLHTVGDKVVGSLPYLSPEQLDGKKLTHRTDIYAFGAVLYEMITARRVYPQKSVVELVRAKTAGQYRPIDDFGLNVPGSVGEIVSRCMHQNPMERYDSAVTVAHEIYSLLTEITDFSPHELLWYYATAPEKIGTLDTMSAGGTPRPRLPHVIGALCAAAVAAAAALYLLVFR